jgi:hypothetical protein
MEKPKLDQNIHYIHFVILPGITGFEGAASPYTSS